ncbi:hypothetical protein MBH78_12950 [Oceanimonas sp. NS1]|nr:hypothetical protein [Oceanimonas sp. NS1]
MSIAMVVFGIGSTVGNVVLGKIGNRQPVMTTGVVLALAALFLPAVCVCQQQHGAIVCGGVLYWLHYWAGGHCSISADGSRAKRAGHDRGNSAVFI